MAPSFPVSARVRFSALGAARCPKMKSRTGTIVKATIGNIVRIRFDGMRTVHAFHRSYLEMITEQPNE